MVKAEINILNVRFFILAIFVCFSGCTNPSEQVPERLLVESSNQVQFIEKHYLHYEELQVNGLKLDCDLKVCEKLFGSPDSSIYRASCGYSGVVMEAYYVNFTIGFDSISKHLEFIEISHPNVAINPKLPIVGDSIDHCNSYFDKLGNSYKRLDKCTIIWLHYRNAPSDERLIINHPNGVITSITYDPPC